MSFKKTRFIVASSVALVSANVCMQAQADTTENYQFALWDFSNYSTGARLTAVPTFGPAGAIGTPLGMSNTYPVGSATNGSGSSFQAPSTNASDITLTSNLDLTFQYPAWRVRGGGPGNGWSQWAPEKTQGVEFDVSTAGFTSVKISFDWYCTTQGVRDMEIQYSADGSTWLDASAANNANVYTLHDDGFSVTTTNYSLGHVQGKSNDFGDRIYVDLSGVALGNASNFKFRMVSIYGTNDSTGTPMVVPTRPTSGVNAAFKDDHTNIPSATNYAPQPGQPMYSSADLTGANGTPIFGSIGYNNASGNWRFANISLTGTTTNAVTGGTLNPSAINYTWVGNVASRVVDGSVKNFTTNTGSGNVASAFAVTNNMVFGDAGVGTVVFGSSNLQNVNANAILVSNTAGTYTFSNALNGGFVTSLVGVATITKTGAGTLVLAPGSQGGVAGQGTFGFTGGVTVNGGELRFAADSALGSGGALTANGGTVHFTGTTSGTRNVVVGSNGATFSVDAGVTAAYSGQFKVGDSTYLNKLVKTGAGVLNLSNADYFAPGGLQLGITGGGVKIALASGQIPMFIAPDWATATSGDLTVSGVSTQLALIATDNAERILGPHGVSYTPTTVGAVGTTGKITFTGVYVEGTPSALPPGIIADHASSNSGTGTILTSGSAVTIDLNMTMDMSVGGTHSTGGRFALGASKFSNLGDTWNTLNVNAPVTGVGSLYFATKSTHGTGTPYRINGGSGLVNINTVLSYVGDTYVAMDKGGVVRLNVDNAFPTGTRLAFGDDGIDPDLDVGSLDLNGHTLTVGSIDLGPSNNKGTYTGINNNSATFANLVLSGSASSTYSGVVGLPPSSSNTYNFILGAPTKHINIATTPTFSGTQTFSGNISANGAVTALAGTIVLANDYKPKADDGVTVAGSLVASGSGVISINVSPSTNSSKVIARTDLVSAAGTGSLTVAAVDRSVKKQSLVVANTISISGSGFVDLTNNDLLVHGQTESAVRSLVASWYNNGTNTHTGLGSSLATTASYTTLAVVSNDNLLGGKAFANFDGEASVFGDVAVKYTYLGDTNIDGKVDVDDLNALVLGLQDPSLTGWRNGDMNYDGLVTLADLNLLLAGQANQGASLEESKNAASPVTAVPEPSAVGLLLPVAAMGLRRKRR